MTDIEWGAEIAVNGVRPEWLTGVQTAWLKTTHWTMPNHCPHVPAEKWSWRYGSDDRPCITAIRLPADHDYYKATSRGFTYWPGGESAPADCGAEALMRYGGMLSGNILDCRWDHIGNSADIIGYRKRTERTAPAIAPELVERMVALLQEASNGLCIERRASDLLEKIAPDPDLTLAKSIVGDAEAIALAIKAARENGRG